ncbi:hypothetical protein M408DRAFT_331550 [Serendipita vermifera MAFF 305830]|uniref:Uncharacterized protein n=1 Tax=Serendipita vermifera MAFF 305830 TaxID=933852 RepID=A0A0C2X6F5_SERVB|nr:hypothetical protein M408DRAFT_331550 [Serendipita vermifera MAFF 305830]
MSDSKNQKETKQNEPTFGILPHPAKTNNPADLNRPRAGEEMPSVGDRMSQLASSGPGPHIMSDKQKTSIGEPLTREELRKRAAELNQ